MTHTDVELLECLEVDSVLDGSCLIGCCLVGLLGSLEFVELLLYCFVLNLLEEEFGFSQLMSRFEQVGASKFVPVERLKVDQFAQFGTTERKERFEGNGEIGNKLQRDVQYSLNALRVGLPHLPRLALGDIAVADAGKIHSLLLCLAELICVEHLLYILLHILKLVESLTVNILQFATGGNNSIPIFLGEL